MPYRSTGPDVLIIHWCFATMMLGLLSFSAPSYTQDVASDTVIEYCVDPDWMPYEAIRNGKHVGISADYLRLIAEKSPIEFKLVVTETWDQSLDFIKQGKCEAISMLNRTPERENYMLFTTPFFEAPNVFVTASSQHFISDYGGLASLRLGVVSGYQNEEYVNLHYPELNLAAYDTENAGLYALFKGEIDVFVGSMLSVISFIQEQGMRGFKIAGFAKPSDIMGMGLSFDRKELLPVLNQAISSITEQEHVAISQKWNSVQVINEIDYRSIWIIVGILSLIGVAVVWRSAYVARFNRVLLNKNELLESLQAELLEKNASLEFMSNHDSLTALYNRHYMVSHCEKEIQRLQRFNQNACLILFDIDWFKQINDNYGHSAGDMILRALAKLINEVIREIDVASRWGGEEFLILCPQTDMEQALVLSQRLKESIEKIEFRKADRVTCSFGVAEYKDNESFIGWFDRADDALYKAKAEGRNRIVQAR